LRRCSWLRRPQFIACLPRESRPCSSRPLQRLCPPPVHRLVGFAATLVAFFIDGERREWEGPTLASGLSFRESERDDVCGGGLQLHFTGSRPHAHALLLPTHLAMPLFWDFSLLTRGRRKVQFGQYGNTCVSRWAQGVVRRIKWHRPRIGEIVMENFQYRE
jgi:hypothetical protein